MFRANSDERQSFAQPGLLLTQKQTSHEEAAYSLTKRAFPGFLGVFDKVRRPTLNETEHEISRQMKPRLDFANQTEKVRAAMEKLM